MQLGKVRSPPIFGIVGLAAAILVLTYSGAIQESFAEVGFIKRGIGLDSSFSRLSYPNDTAPFNIGGAYYVVVGGAEGLHLVTVTNPDSLNRNNANGNLAAQGNVTDVDTYVSSGTTRIVVLWKSSTAIQLGTVNSTGNGLDFINTHSLKDTTRLANPSGLAIYSPTAGNTYAVVTANSPTGGVISEGGGG
ncbi:MAG: hypothetical protein OXC46_07975, partial [Thaumarchaeota archaeon]|nr:hypothetical protein [Nitrososphaerota archaeon]